MTKADVQRNNIRQVSAVVEVVSGGEIEERKIKSKIHDTWVQQKYIKKMVRSSGVDAILIDM